MPAPAHDGDLAKQKAILERLRDEMEQAKALYEGTKEAYEKAKKEYDNLGTMPPTTLKHVIDTHEFIREIYSLSVQRFNDYLLREDLPKAMGTTGRRLHRVS